VPAFATAAVAAREDLPTHSKPSVARIADVAAMKSGTIDARAGPGFV
jgi:hypothetical protein